MTDKEFKRLSRAQLMDIIYQLQLKQEELEAENLRLKQALEDKRLRIDRAGNIAAAALEMNNVMQAAQRAADQYLEEIRIMRQEAEEECTPKAGKQQMETAEKPKADEMQIYTAEKQKEETQKTAEEKPQTEEKQIPAAEKQPEPKQTAAAEKPKRPTVINADSTLEDVLRELRKAKAEMGEL